MTISRERFLPPAWISVLLTIAGVLWLISELREMVVLMIVSYTIAYIIHPIIHWLELRKISRDVAVLGVLSIIVLGVLILLMTAVPTVLAEATDFTLKLPEYLQTLRTKLQPQLESISRFFPAEVRGVVTGENPEQATGLVSGGIIDKVTAAFGAALLQGYSLTLALLNLMLLPFLVYYLSVDFRRLHQGLLELFPVADRPTIIAISQEIDGYVSAFVRGQVIVCSILFVLYAIGLKIVGVEFWFLLSVLSGFGNMIPYIGTLLGIVLASMMALITFGEFGPVFKVWLVFAAVQFMEGFFITPKVMGKNVGMSPLAVILAIFIGGKLFGLLGIFLAIPAAAALRVLGRHLHRKLIRAVG